MFNAQKKENDEKGFVYRNIEEKNIQKKVIIIEITPSRSSLNDIKVDFNEPNPYKLKE